MSGYRSACKLNVAIAAGKAFNSRRFAGGIAGGLRVVFRAFCEVAVGFHPQHAVNQRAAGKELTVVSITAIAMFLNRGIGAQGPGPLLADFW